jgi:hypothetical protein
MAVRLLGRDCIVKSFLGRGKSAYSWLVTDGEDRYVYKKMHNERVEHYTFSDKVLSEVDAWKRLCDAGAPVPRLLEWNAEKQYLVKEYIEGTLASELAARGSLTDTHFALAWKLHLALRDAGLHIDYFPTNFVFREIDSHGEIFYIDYECHPYSPEWDFERWGIYYWLNASGMREHLETGTTDLLNRPGTPKPFTEPFEARKREILDAIAPISRIEPTTTRLRESGDAEVGA